MIPIRAFASLVIDLAPLNLAGPSPPSSSRLCYVLLYRLSKYVPSDFRLPFVLLSSCHA